MRAISILSGLLVLFLLGGAAALADDGEPPPPPGDEEPAPPPGTEGGMQPDPPSAPAPGTAPGPGALDLDGYAKNLVDSASRYAAAGDHASAYAYLKQVRATLGQTKYVRDNRPAIDGAFHDAEDAVAKDLYDRAAEIADKNPAGARQRTVKLRVEFESSRFLRDHAAEVDVLETKIRTAMWGGAGAYRGAAVLPREGTLRLTYGFDKIEELGDFDEVAPPPAPRVEGGRLAAGRPGQALKHRLQVAAGATFTAEVEARGHGKVAFALEGGLVFEADSGPKALAIALRRPDDKAAAPAAAEDPRAPNQPAATPWRVRVERRDGRVIAATIRPGGAVGVSVEAPAAAASVPADARGGPAVKPGVTFVAGKVELESLVVELPLPADETAAAGGGGGKPGPAKPPLPRGVWIPLAKDGLASWKAQGEWTFKDGVLRPRGATGSLSSKELEDRTLERYTFTVEVKVEVDEEADRMRRLARDLPIFGIVLPVGEKKLFWRIDNRSMVLDGAEVQPGAGAAKHGAGLPPGKWTALSFKVGAQGVEAFVGAQKIFAFPLSKLDDAERNLRLDTLGFVALPGPRNVEIREPKIKLE